MISSIIDLVLLAALGATSGSVLMMYRRLKRFDVLQGEAAREFARSATALDRAREAIADLQADGGDMAVTLAGRLNEARLLINDIDEATIRSQTACPSPMRDGRQAGPMAPAEPAPAGPLPREPQRGEPQPAVLRTPAPAVPVPAGANALAPAPSGRDTATSPVAAAAARRLRQALRSGSEAARGRPTPGRHAPAASPTAWRGPETASQETPACAFSAVRGAIGSTSLRCSPPHAGGATEPSEGAVARGRGPALAGSARPLTWGELARAAHRAG